MTKQMTLKLTPAQENALRTGIRRATHNMEHAGSDEFSWYRGSESLAPYRTFSKLAAAGMITGEGNETPRMYGVLFVGLEGWFYALAHNWISELPDFAYDYSELLQYFEAAPAAVEAQVETVEDNGVVTFKVGDKVQISNRGGDELVGVIIGMAIDNDDYIIKLADGTLYSKPASVLRHVETARSELETLRAENARLRAALEEINRMPRIRHLDIRDAASLAHQALNAETSVQS